MPDPRDTDLILAPNEFIYISDSNTGLVKPVVGPTKKTLDSVEQPMVYDWKAKRFIRTTSPREAIQLFTIIDERSYCILDNPAAEGEIEHPKKGQDNPMPILAMGQKKNIPGPATFALWPGQVSNVIQGHQLRSNQYLRCVVHNSKEAMSNWNKAVVDTAGSSESGDLTKDEVSLVTGQILIVKGTEVSYYIPPTGIYVVQDDSGNYVRDAVTLERLEYCILLDESGEKRYVKGPAVVFPNPTETFVEKDGARKFDAIELNDNMGIHIKVIADYEEGKRKFVAGDEIFITGKELKIYYPRSEHAIIKYDDNVRTYAVAIPKGEARYALDKDTGDIKTVKGPQMYLPNPTEEVIVRRVLSDKEVTLWFPGNTKAMELNQMLREQTQGTGEKYLRSGTRSMSYSSEVPLAKMASALYSNTTVAGDDVQRHTKFVPPRTLTLDSKYDGAVNINVYPGYAVQVVSKDGTREVVIGPKSVILEYDQTLEVMELSTGKPKSDHTTIKTVYLNIKNNRVSDVVEAITKDLVNINARVNYRVNFEGDPKAWYSVDNYVKFLTQNLRSIIRGEIQKHGIEEVSQNFTSIIRNVILGIAEKDKPRPGRSFEENGMRIYDVEVLSVEIGDESIRDQLESAQHQAVQSALQIARKKQDLESTKIIEGCDQEISDIRKDSMLKKLKNQAAVTSEETTAELQKLITAKDAAHMRTDIESILRADKDQDMKLQLINEETLLKIRTEAYERRFKAIQPELIAALQAMNQSELAQAFVEHIPAAGGGIGMLLGEKLIENILGLLGNSGVGDSLRGIVNEVKQAKK